VIAQNLLQAFERYYIAIAALVRNGPHTLSAGELENLCTLTAQRLSLLQELNAPEFFDKQLFRGFIQKLRERKVVWADDAGKLDFDAELEGVARDAKVILSREIRHGILKLTPERREAIAEPAASESKSDD
jgi:glycerol-3-phosphate O-acyltransferase